MDYPLHQPVDIINGQPAGAPRPRDGVHVDEVRGLADIPIVQESKPTFDPGRERPEMAAAAAPMPFDAKKTKWVEAWVKKPLPLAERKAIRLASVRSEIDAIRRAIVGDNPAQIATYDRKGELAVRALSGDAAAVALLDREAGPMGVTAAVLAVEITAKADAWLAATMDLEGARRAFGAAVSAATTVADLDAVADPDFSAVRTALGIAAA